MSDDHATQRKLYLFLNGLSVERKFWPIWESAWAVPCPILRNSHAVQVAGILPTVLLLRMFCPAEP